MMYDLIEKMKRVLKKLNCKTQLFMKNTPSSVGKINKIIRKTYDMVVVLVKNIYEVQGV